MLVKFKQDFNSKFSVYTKSIAADGFSVGDVVVPIFDIMYSPLTKDYSKITYGEDCVYRGESIPDAAPAGHLSGCSISWEIYDEAWRSLFNTPPRHPSYSEIESNSGLKLWGCEVMLVRKSDFLKIQEILDESVFVEQSLEDHLERIRSAGGGISGMFGMFGGGGGDGDSPEFGGDDED